MRQSFDAGEGAAGALDLNNVSRSRLATRLQELDPEKLRASRSVTEFTLHYEEMAERLVDHRTQQGGILQDFETLAGLNLPTPVAEAFRKYAVLGSFSVISVDSVGPKVGRELRKRARDAVIFSLLGMLIYIAYRFKPIYGLAAIVALFHDVFITVGAFSIANKEISLTVIAALLTLVGYSINDTIVCLRSGSREPATDAACRHEDHPQPQHQPDPEPDDHDFGDDFSGCALPPGARR